MLLDCVYILILPLLVLLSHRTVQGAIGQNIPSRTGRTQQSVGWAAHELESEVNFSLAAERNTLHNRSKLPNFVLRRGLLRVCRPVRERVDVQLEAESGVLVDSFSVEPVRMVSQQLDQLKDKDRTFIQTGLQKEYRSFVVLQDVNLNTWAVGATFSEIGLDSSLEPLAKEADRAVSTYFGSD